MPVDLRTRKLAQVAVNHCAKVKPGEKVILSGGSEAIDFLVELYKEVILKKGIPIVKVGLPNVSDFFYKYADEKQIGYFPQEWFDVVKKADKYIGINSEFNAKELTSADSKKVAQRKKVIHPISDYVVNEKDKIRRVTIAYPSVALAQEAEMSLTEYENFVYGACLQDWKKLDKRMDKLKKIFEKGSEVWLKGEGVDLRFSIKGKNCIGDSRENMPGGEVFMAPVRESLNGWIKFDYPRIVSGKQISEVFLKFENGKVVEYDAEKGKEFLKELLNTDENASYIGEFGIGCNPKVNRYTNDLLFDEKINGTIHLALGMAYKDNGGGNDSAIHVDIVKDMSNARIVLDGRVVQDKGRWRV